MSEAPLNLVVDGQTVRGVFHAAHGGASDAPAVLWLHGFAGTRVEAHRLFVDGARRLAAKGVASLRIDFRGCGESDGGFEQTSVTTMAADARAALAALRLQPGVDAERVAVLGFSLGAAIASQLADAPGLKALVAWSPMVFPVPIFARLGLYAAHPELSRQGWIDWHGQRVGRGLLNELAMLDPLGALAGFEQPIYVLSGAEDNVATGENAQALLSELAKAEGEQLPHGDHAYTSALAREWVLSRTERWLSARLLASADQTAIR